MVNMRNLFCLLTYVVMSDGVQVRDEGRGWSRRGLARQFLGQGIWHVWDMLLNTILFCKECSSAAERIVRHDRDHRCPKVLGRAAAGERGHLQLGMP